MSVYYNENDSYCAQWLRNLIGEGLIAPGDVDDRDIREVSPSDLDGYTQCHFFAGLGGWARAIDIAGWGSRPVWTGSPPCQPFSAAGKGGAYRDPRDLWPEWFRLIKAVRPPVIYGEQVEAAIGWGWLDLVHSDMEAEGYAVRAAVLPACGVGAPHIRQRLWFVADATGEQNGEPRDARETGEPNGGLGTVSGRADGIMGNSELSGLEKRNPPRGMAARGAGPTLESQGPWHNLIWLPCADGKQRPTQSGIFPLAHGVPARVAKLRAAGNAIVPQVAAEFIKAATEVMQ